jgi:hypothetical protein
MLLEVCELIVYENIGGDVGEGGATYEAILEVELSLWWNRGSCRILKP